MPPEKHAMLGASSAERWLNCPPSARLTENMPDTGSDYAAAGTLAHKIAELKARKYFMEPMPKRTYNSRLKKLQADPLYEKGMDAATDMYLEHLQARSMSYEAQPAVALEVQVDFSDIVPGGFGTADCIMIGGDCITVVDYKNGAGVPVEAGENPQMMLYAWGALHLYRPIFGDTIQRVHLAIVQPNAGGVKEWSTTVAHVEDWINAVVRPAADLAWRGEGPQVPGDWCRFCAVKGNCAARAQAMLEVEPMVGSCPSGSDNPAILYADGKEAVRVLSDDQIGDILTRARGVAAWLKDLEAYALRAVLSGRPIAGWEAVEGRRSPEWGGGCDTAVQALQARGVAEAVLYERKPVSVAGLEKALGRKDFAATAEGLWVSSPGAPTLAPENDKRPPYSPAVAAFEKVVGEG